MIHFVSSGNAKETQSDLRKRRRPVFKTSRLPVVPALPQTSSVTFEQSVLPMVRAADDGHPRRTGSCVLVLFGGRPFLVTAKHTLDNSPQAIHVGCGGAKLIPLPIE